MKYIVLVLLVVWSVPVQAGHQVKSKVVDTVTASVAAHNCSKPVSIGCCRTIRVEDPNHIAPCSVATEITVCDPYTCKEIKLTVCMPQGCLARQMVKSVTRRGRKVKYDYGRYEVEIHFSKRGIVIDYDD